MYSAPGRGALALGAFALAAQPARAAGRDGDDGYGAGPQHPLDYPFTGSAPLPDHDRRYDMTFGLRLRSVSVPRGLLDVWFFDEDDEDWAYIDPRPRLRGTAVGIEYGLRARTGSGLFYFEFVDAGIEPGYWDDVESPADHLDGDFVVPAAGTGLLAFGADYAYEAHLVRTEQTGGRIGASILVGGGLGLGILAGRIDRWGVDAQGNPSYKRYLDGLPPDSGSDVPRVYPMVDIDGKLRLDLGGRVLWQIEGGVHTLLYYGTSVAVVF